MTFYEDDYRASRAFSDGFTPKIIPILSTLLIVPSSFQQDTKEAVDLVVLGVKDMKVACRVRKKRYYPRYAGQVTIRSWRDTGTTTELEKLRGGFGDWLFFGFSSDDDSKILGAWIVMDLHSLREIWDRCPDLIDDPDHISTGFKSNGGDTHFFWMNVGLLPKFQEISDLVVASSGWDLVTRSGGASARAYAADLK